MKTIRLLLLVLLAGTAVAGEAQEDLRPSTIANDASCDIAVQPAATLLVPYFEVDVTTYITTARTTIFTITNVSRLPQIANVTLWSNLDRPVMNFPIFLTGYDVQAINLYDVIVSGVLAPTTGTSNATTPGSRSAANSANPRFLPSAAAQCSKGAIPVTLPPELLEDVRRSLTAGRTAACPGPVAIPNAVLATGYITIDVVATCTTGNPTSADYWDVLLYDNVLMGDWQVIAPNASTGNYAGGNPMVHIRAVPEGGAAGTATVSPLPFTFYDRLTPDGRRRTDRRQPLPSTFLSRFIQGGATSFATELVIWREGLVRPGSGACKEMVNDTLAAEIVRFDERENPTVRVANETTIGVARSIGTANELFPPLANDVGGWLYLNLNNGGSSAYSIDMRYDLTSDSSTVRGPRQSQAWVTTRMAAEGRYAVAYDAMAFGNGCTTAPASPTFASAGATLRPIGPDQTGGGVKPLTVTHRNDDSCDIATLPAATLLVPYFEVQLRQQARTTLFTVVNTTNTPQIARVTLWSDWGFPALTFDVFLTGYDVQAMNLYDVLVGGRLPGGGLPGATGQRSLPDNPLFLQTAWRDCSALPATISPALLEDVRRILTEGLHDGCGTNRLGAIHPDRAVGYLTVDVVATCSAKAPGSAGAIQELLFDNVLTGDYEIIDPNPATGNYASGSPAVHIRAIPEGGRAGEQVATRLPLTFYDGLYGQSHRDRRQPLPSAFAARYIQGGAGGFETDLLLWSAPATNAASACSAYASDAARPAEVVRFDERENSTIFVPLCIINNCIVETLELPVTSRQKSSSSAFPPLESGDVAGWMYVNAGRQMWMISAMYAEGRYSVAFDAAALANGCSPLRPPLYEAPIGPSPVN